MTDDSRFRGEGKERMATPQQISSRLRWPERNIKMGCHYLYPHKQLASGKQNKCKTDTVQGEDIFSGRDIY